MSSAVNPAIADEAARKGTNSGIIAGLWTMGLSGSGVWAALKYSPKFRKLTNYQVRTALVIMPPFFAFALAGEIKVNELNRHSADEREYARRVKKWATDVVDEDHKDKADYEPLSIEEREKKLSELYKKSVAGMGVRIVPGDNLGIHHRVANFWQENPFKVLSAAGAGAVFYIFKGRQGKQHLQLQQKLMQTRVVGQFTVLIFLLSLMGFKEYMDTYGKFITEADAEKRVVEIRDAKAELEYRLAEDAAITDNVEKVIASQRRR
eukprot:CAMPEP_0195525964 /NCGR_PEP_ID=MMETSP0794_2-20130614/26712_1 /TAXON_ID=515487 /ORGANISM="Stephanopyxis turris, Strain CCMP 815" /LENGTH=263 /DNA_ID=CAMNT_0040656553 /DNA_START=12 /DNA_END=803 /DNA_ORIENTATION=+